MTAPVRFAEVQTDEGKLWVPYEVRRNRRARNLKLSVTAHRNARLSVPPFVSDSEAERFLQDNGQWVCRHLGELPARTTLLDYLYANPRLSAHGRDLPLHLRFSAGRSAFELEEDTIRFLLDRTAPAEEALLALLRTFAREVLRARAVELAGKIGAGGMLGRVSVRDQSTIWGSCSQGRNLSLNWRLVLLPAALQDYILYHELAHLYHLNHSRAFWNLLQRLDPQAFEHDEAVTARSLEIMLLGR